MVSQREQLVASIDRPELPPPGEKQRGVLTFSHPMLAGWEWPYVAVRGTTGGPDVVMLSGVHAGEYPPMIANIRFMRQLDPRDLRGTIVSVPLVDPPAFYARSAFVCPVDGKNPNRCFPGNPTGTFSEVLADAVFRNLISHGTHLIDLHCGDIFEHLAPFVISRLSGNEQVDSTALGMAKAFGLPYVVATAPTGEILAGTTSASSAQAGIPAITAEVGGRGLLTEPDVEMQMQGISNVLKHIGSLEGEPDSPEQQRVLRASRSVISPAEGLWFPEVDLEEEVTAGQRMGRIENLFGDELSAVRSPASGPVLYLTSSPAVYASGLLGSIGEA